MGLHLLTLHSSPDGSVVYYVDSINGVLYALNMGTGVVSTLYSGAPLSNPTALFFLKGDIIIADQVCAICYVLRPTMPSRYAFADAAGKSGRPL